MLKKFSPAVLFLILFSCNKPGKPTQKQFVYELPKPKGNAGYDFEYGIKCSLTEQLGLTRLEDGVDSFELRFWDDIAIANPKKLSSLKRVNNKWYGIQYFLWVHNQKPSEGKYLFEYVLDSAQLVVCEPYCGWQALLDSIMQKGILTLPSQYDIKGFEADISDGRTYYVEYATPNKYKFYTYNIPGEFPEFKECRQMDSIVQIWNGNLSGCFAKSSY